MTHNVLAVLDMSARIGTFPNLNNGYNYLSGCRVTAYTDRAHWALVFEILGYFYKYYSTRGFCNWIYVYGSSHTCKNPSRKIISPVTPGSSGPILRDDNYINTDIVDIQIRGRLYPVHIKQTFFAEAGVAVTDLTRIHAADFMRAVTYHYSEALYATDSEIAEEIPGSIPHVLRLTAWRHPDLTRGELPSHLLTFHQIATVIHSGNPHDYTAPEAPNTHWRHWPMSGML